MTADRGETGPPPPSTLIVPLVMWASKPPPLKITCLQFLGQGEHIVAGSDSGVIVLWRCAPDGLTPRLMMTGHCAAITALTPASLSHKSTRFISASADGEVSLWDWQDGRCIDAAESNYLHRRMVPYLNHTATQKRTIIICSGEYNDLVVLDPSDLTVMFYFNSRVEPDWVSSFLFVHRAGKTDACVGLTMAGMIKLWRMIDLDRKTMDTPAYEDESKRLALNQVRDSSYDTVNESLMLVVCEHTWHVIDLDDLSVIVTGVSEGNLVSGRVVDVDKVAIAGNDGTLRLYQLPITQLRGQQAEERFGPAAGRQNVLEGNKLDRGRGGGAVEFARLDSLPKELYHEWLSSCSWTFLALPGGEYIAARAERGTGDGGEGGGLLLWRLPRYESDFMRKLSGMQQQLPLKYKGTHENSLARVWEQLQYSDEENFPNLGDEHVTASLYVPSQGRMLMGMRDGFIVTRYICELISSRFLAEGASQWRNSTRAMRAHRSSVRSLLHPASHHPRFDSNLVLSGGDDHCVVMWHISTATRIHRFTVNGGPVTRFLIPPENTSKAISKCVCAVGEDASIALLNVRDLKCQLLAARHPAPIDVIRFRPLDDYMLVRLKDGDVYVWQLETASLDRIASGMTASDMMLACDEVEDMKEVTDEAGATSAVQLVRALRHRNLQAVKKVGGGLAHNSKDASPSTATAAAAAALPYVDEPTTPVTVFPLMGNDGAHVVLFDVVALVNAINILDQEDDRIEHLPSTSTTVNNTMSRQDSERSLSARLSLQFESTLLHDLARIVLSLLHAWNLDDDLDRVCAKKLQLQPIARVPTFASSTRGDGKTCIFMPSAELTDVKAWSLAARWSYASSLNTVHLLATIGLLNTLMALRGASWTRTKRTTTSMIKKEKEGGEREREVEKQSQCGWSVAIAFHLVLLPNALKQRGKLYAPPRLELLARKWQDSCFEVRQAAQAILVRELSRIEASGRRRLIESWAPFLPPMIEGPNSLFFYPKPPTHPGHNSQQSSIIQTPTPPPIPPRSKKEGSAGPSLPSPTTRVPDRDDGETWGSREIRRNQATAVVVLAVVGGEFGDELAKADLTRVTALSLLELLVCPHSKALPMQSPLRRAAIDLLGRGFTQWEPHLEIAKVLLGLLALASQTSNKDASVAMRLSPSTDAQRTARHALSMIARARAPAFIASLSMEVARYNSAAQHQTIQSVPNGPLLKSRHEVLRIIEELSTTNYNDVVDYMLPLGDLLVHCLDATLLKHRSLNDIFPPISKFSMVSYCPSSRRIAFGGKNGAVVVHDLRATRTQNLHAHSCPVSACAFSEDGKMLATYGGDEGKINLWQTTQSFLGMGQSSLKCVKTQPAPVLERTGETPKARIVWINPKAITLMLPGNKEQRFAV
ncbi:hypothetical protein PFISCL1PPCAC_11833 [Pristionchus fissidentatus]|uniref:WD40 domain-containing protein n=1 Tax=Pristionchus fissidentatus TaxID=1538716 RepID=A0AAV5VLP1_9BILA|nr:hypothetical protein PFISCL1PPCAC_11833 [Pristionchus fissidentatus]